MRKIRVMKEIREKERNLILFSIVLL